MRARVVADQAEAQAALGGFGGVGVGDEPELVAGRVVFGGSGAVFDAGADDGGDQQQGGVGVSFADGVEEAVDGRDEGAQAQGVGVDDVDAHLTLTTSAGWSRMARAV